MPWSRNGRHKSRAVVEGTICGSYPASFFPFLLRRSLSILQARADGLQDAKQRHECFVGGKQWPGEGRLEISASDKLSDNVAPVNCFTTSWKRAAASARPPENWRSFDTDFSDKDLSDMLAYLINANEQHPVRKILSFSLFHRGVLILTIEIDRKGIAMQIDDGKICEKLENSLFKCCLALILNFNTSIFCFHLVIWQTQQKSYFSQINKKANAKSLLGNLDFICKHMQRCDLF
ncbi:hypothetical protein T08_15846 [Trichinella sp. T8]|nr:hypothetical protein T08_15846 [Trichinella sp. T8]